MIDFSKISSGLKKKDGIWHSEIASNISYLEKGNDIFYRIEESSFWFKHRNKVLEVLMRKYDPGSFILDVGVGNGYTTKFLQINGYKSVLVEPGIDGVINAKRRGVINIINSTISSAEFNKNSIPAIGMFDVLEHIKDENKLLSEINSLLKDDGRLYITVPAYNVLWSSEDVIAGHYRRYRSSNIAKILKGNGFEIEYLSYFFSILFLPVLFFRSIPSLIMGIFKIKKTEPVIEAHEEKSSFINSMINLFLKLELNRIRKGKKLWFGSSIIVICKKQ